MYGGMGGGDVGSAITSTTVAGSGAVVLPQTAGNALGTTLAVIAITIGVTALISQLIVRLLRRHYS